MSVPTAITDLSTTPASNSPTGTESIGTNLDDYLRAGFAFIRQLYNTKAALAGDTFTGNVNVPSLNGGQLAGSRRRNVNGDMRFDLKNAGAAVTINSGVYTYPVDNCAAFGTTAAGVFTGQQQSSSPPAGFKYYTRFTTATADASPAAGSIYIVDFPVEGRDLHDFGLGTANAIQFTTGAQVRSSLTGTFCGSLRNAANNRSYPFTFTIASANTWTPLVVTLTGDTTGTWATDATTGLIVCIDLGSGNTYRSTAGTWQAGQYFGVTSSVRVISTLNATFDITGVQVEPGSQKTPYEMHDEPAEERWVMRFAQPIRGGLTGFANGTTTVDCGYTFQVPMRAAPTISNGNVIAYAFNAAGAFTQSSNSASLPNNVSQAGANVRFSNFTGLTSNSPTTITPNSTTSATTSYLAFLSARLL